MKLNIPRHIDKIKPYVPGRSVEDVEREYGLRGVVKLASNENPFPPSASILEAVTAALPKLNRYPDGSCRLLVAALAGYTGLTTDELVVGNGSDDLIDCLVRAFVEEGDEVITSHPSFLMYGKNVQVRGGINRVIPQQEMHHDLQGVLAAVGERTRLIFLDNPNNPTGNCIKPVDFYLFLSDVPEHVVVVVDEAYVEFMEDQFRPDALSLLRNTGGRAPVVFLRTFSKAWGLPGLRIGYAMMPKEVAAVLHKVRQPFNVNTLAQVAAVAALNDEAAMHRGVMAIHQGREFLRSGLTEIGCHVWPTQTNFLLVDVKKDANAVAKTMQSHGVIIRSMASYDLPSCVRITCGTELENLRCIEALEKSLAAC